MELALEQVTRMGAYHVRAVRQACRRAAALPPPAAAPPARVLHLPEVEERRLAACHFPFVKRLQDFEWDAQPTLNRAEVERLFNLSFIDAHGNVAFLGAPGLGKTMLAVGLGVAAVEAGYSVRFSRLDEWALDAQAADAVGSLAFFLREWLRPQLVILDEVGHHSLSTPASRAFCQLLTHRYTRGSVVLTSNRGLHTWQQFLGDEVLAAAVLDRFLHHATVFSQTGESYRLKDAKRRRGKS